MQQQPQTTNTQTTNTNTTNIALVIVALAVGGALLLAFLTRNPDSGSLTGGTWQLASITGQTPGIPG